MLKIVDYYPNTKIPFPLKELETFGFKWDEDYKEYYIFSKDKDEKLWVTHKKHLLIEDFSGFSMVEYLDIIFDLIQAGLVEKVEE